MAGAGPPWAPREWNTGGDVLWRLTVPSLRAWGTVAVVLQDFVWRKAVHSSAPPCSTSPCVLDIGNHTRGVCYVLENTG